MSDKQPPGISVLGADNKELLRITAIERAGTQLVLRGKIFGTMPMTAKLRPDEARKAYKLLNMRLFLFLITFLFRRST